MNRVAKSGDKEALETKEFLEMVQAHVDSGNHARTLVLTEGQKLELRDLHLLTMKPVLYIANVDEDGFENNPYLDAVRDIAAREDSALVVICNKLEAEIAELDDGEKLEFLNDLGMEEPGLDRVIRAGYILLSLQTYFTAGDKEVRAWTVKQNATAPKAAAVIHTDFEKGFIRAEVVAYNDFITGNGEAGAKEAGNWRLEGKDYLVQDGDVINFRFNV